ncbi:hypothetical protein [Streptomyces graminofaciens]|uniref:hypothetical protein n=1 Tax=Streptomyces graminofaciens TaxID=68212 RepID=UPI0025731F14|nr:hypothetical protein [Streptomyces graminofaciens]
MDLDATGPGRKPHPVPPAPSEARAPTRRRSSLAPSCEPSLFGSTAALARTENYSTRTNPSTMIDLMFRHAFPLAASALTADAPKAAVEIFLAAVDGARS